MRKVTFQEIFNNLFMNDPIGNKIVPKHLKKRLSKDDFLFLFLNFLKKCENM